VTGEKSFDATARRWRGQFRITPKDFRRSAVPADRFKPL
jgi:hypothetical protein